MPAVHQKSDAKTYDVAEGQEDGEKDQQPPARAQTVWSLQKTIVRRYRRGNGVTSIAHTESRRLNPAPNCMPLSVVAAPEQALVNEVRPYSRWLQSERSSYRCGISCSRGR